MESLNFFYPFHLYDMKDVTCLAKKCSNSLVYLNIYPQPLINFKKVFKHAKKLDHFGYGFIDEDSDYNGFKFPPNIRGLCIQELNEASFPFLLPYLNQLRELNLVYHVRQHDCQCFFFERCPNLEVLVTHDICGDIGLQVIGLFCKKLRKLTYYGRMTQMGLIALAQGCPNLEYLEVGTLLDISNEALACVGTHLKNLRDFRTFLKRGVRITADLPLDNGVRAMLIGCSKLERLWISFGGLTDVGVGYIGKYGHNLTDLSLINTGESDLGLLELSKGCPNLRKLRLGSCPFSKQAVATFVFNNNHSLRYVWIEHSVLTRPMVYDEVLTQVYITLAEKLHRFAVQLVVSDGYDARFVKITYASSRATDDLDSRLVWNLAARDIQKKKGLLLDGSSEKPLEIIVQIDEVVSHSAIAASEFGEIELQGRVKDGVPHLTKLGAFEVDVRLDGHILLCKHVDEPNIICCVASILGEENVNIMSVEWITSRKQAVMVIAIDEKPSEEALKKIGDIPEVEGFVFLAL